MTYSEKFINLIIKMFSVDIREVENILTNPELIYKNLQEQNSEFKINFYKELNNCATVESIKLYNKLKSYDSKKIVKDPYDGLSSEEIMKIEEYGYRRPERPGDYYRFDKNGDRYIYNSDEESVYSEDRDYL